MPLLDLLEFWGRTYEIQIRLEQSCKSSHVGRIVSVERVAFGWLWSCFSIDIGHR